MSRQEWKRFERVSGSYLLSGKRLYRASAPNYQDKGTKPKDATQRLTSTAVDFLRNQGIDGVISLNEYPYKYSERSLLTSIGIGYLHLPLPDYKTPTLENMDDAYDFFLDHRSTLIHCGYGHGRTGTMVTALQLCCTDGRYPREEFWEDNYVETKDQMNFLRSVRSDVSRWPKDKYSTVRGWKREGEEKGSGQLESADVRRPSRRERSRQ